MTRRGLARDRRGATAVEFALVAPVFLMFVFLMLDGGRMIFAKQTLNEIAVRTARCAALKTAPCQDKAAAETFAVNRGRKNRRLVVTAVVTPSGNCNNRSGMAKAIVSTTWRRGAMQLLPQSLAPATLSATACFPVA